MQTRCRRRWCWVHRLAIGACLLAATMAHASEHRGQVSFNGLPVPGATVSATQDAKKSVAISDTQGVYSFPDLADGAWKIHIEMSGFASQEQSITVSPSQPGIRWELKMLPLEQVLAQTKAVKSAPVVAENSVAAAVDAPRPAAPKPVGPEAPRPPAEESSQANDGFLVNGSVNNAATSQFSLAQAFGNTRKGSKSLYTGGFGLIFGNAALDARPYSLSGLETPKSGYNQITLITTLGGPIHIPHLMPHGPNFTAAYQWTRNSTAAALTGLMPTEEQRDGILAGGNVASISPQARALLTLYPLPNIAGNASYNYQTSLANSLHQDALQTRLDKSIGRRDQVYGLFVFQNNRTSTTNLFGFVDNMDTLGLNTNINWSHRLSRGIYLTSTYRFSRLHTRIAPYFANRADISGGAGIAGNSRAPDDWGPPTLTFSSGIATLNDGLSTFNRNRTDGISSSVAWYHGRHNITVGGDFRRQEYNYLSQQNPRGAFTFTGAATGKSDFADFLTGVPDTSTLAFGNADKYFRQSVYDAYATDDWRLRPDLTLNVGLRWEYGAPLTELKDRLVNLDIASGFGQVAPVLASNPMGRLTGQRYPTSLVRPDKSMIEPRLSLSWRPLAGSSMVVRAGFGIYADTSVYQATMLAMAQQAPLSKSLSVQNGADCPLTLANGFTPCSSTTQSTFAIDPNFRVGYAEVWQVAVQRDLPAAMQMTATYLGIQGTHGVQEFLPNTYALGAANPCQQCPVGFDYRTSNGSSSREAGSVQLRRRLRSGFAASLLYTFSKSLDDDSLLGGQGPIAAGATTQSSPTAAIAQNWLRPGDEHSLSSFDQRHLLTSTVQYTSGMGMGGATLMGGWRGHALKEWTLLAQITAGSGLPETPVYYAAVNGTGFTGSLRPDRTTASLRNASAGRFLNADAFAAPQIGQWGNAGRNSITGPGQLTFNFSLARTFRLDQRWNLDLRADATNLLNHAVFSSYNTTLNPAATAGATLSGSSPLFGLPAAANPMRSVLMTARMRF